MYLSRLRLNSSRRAYLWSSQPYRIHQRLCLAAPDDPRLLWRIEAEQNCADLLVQSHEKPDWEASFAEFPVLASPPQQKPVDWALQAGRLLSFRLRANPTARKTFDEQGRSVSKRVGLLTEAEQRDWLRRKGLQGGFEILFLATRQEGMLQGTRRGAKGIQLLSVRFDGLLRVTDPETLRQSIAAGIGSGKAFGFGLLTLAPAGL